MNLMDLVMTGRESDTPAWLISNDFIDEASLGLK